MVTSKGSASESEKIRFVIEAASHPSRPVINTPEPAGIAEPVKLIPSKTPDEAETINMFAAASPPFPPIAQPS